jgi:hypothetical protein
MNALLKAKKQSLELTLSKVAEVNVEITFARTNMITVAWDGENKSVFDKLQNYFKGKLFDYEYDEECNMSVCCLAF